MAGPRELPELEAFLGGIPFFAALDEASRLELAGQLEPVHVAAGEVVFRQGDAGDGLYLVGSGRLRVSVAAEGGEGDVLRARELGVVLRELVLHGELACLLEQEERCAGELLRDRSHGERGARVDRGARLA